jgi:hypothetical protein
MVVRCTVRALAIVTGWTYDKAYDLLKQNGRRSHINEGASVYFFATEQGMDAIGLTPELKGRALDQ